MKNSLIEAGFEVIVAYKGADAIASFDNDPENIIALVSDIGLGRGPTGWDVARHARSIRPEPPVIYMSGDGAADWPSMGVPNSIMIAKPFVMQQIIVGLGTLLKAGGPLPP